MDNLNPCKICFWFIPLLVACSGNTPKTTEDDRWWTEQERLWILGELNRTTGELQNEIERLSQAQWYFREEESRWNIGEIVEHLEMQNQLHYREIAVIANSPQYLEYRTITKGQDGYFTKYATDSIKGQANWFLQPKDKFLSKEAAEEAFYTARGKLTEYVEKTKADLRKQFTFRAPMYEMEISEVKIGEVRDLHQLLLTGIAHTDRHLIQIRNIKKHKGFPTN
ncbi:MAG: DinB family protein [Cyclobacteriaceae bacterium]